MALGIYKPGQGYWTRVISVCALFIIGLAGANWLWTYMTSFKDASRPDAVMNSVWARGALPALILFASIAMCYWLYGTNRKTVDFFVSTEGEMKKVNWSTRREIVGSTWVVVMVAVLMATLLFTVDSSFAEFFKAIGVLQGDSALSDLFGGGK